MTSTVVVSIHDVHPTTAGATRRLLELVEDRGLVATLLVVPGPWRGQRLVDDAAFGRWLRDVGTRGHELALHGWSSARVDGPPTTRIASWRDRWLARGCGEFVDVDAAGDLLARGLDALAEFAVHPIGFTPPGWLASDALLDALHRLGFAYSTTRWGVVDLWGDRTIRCPAIAQRPGSPLSGVGAIATRRVVVRRVVRGDTVRLALHPADIDDPRLLETTRCALDVVACGRTITYAELVTGTEPGTGDRPTRRAVMTCT